MSIPFDQATIELPRGIGGAAVCRKERLTERDPRYSQGRRQGQAGRVTVLSFQQSVGTIYGVTDVRVNHQSKENPFSSIPE